jgi:hypothetical protein
MLMGLQINLFFSCVRLRRYFTQRVAEKTVGGPAQVSVAVGRGRKNPSTSFGEFKKQAKAIHEALPKKSFNKSGKARMKIARD